MGVPSFYRWLANRYPKTVVNAVEDDGSPGTNNPNGFEFDNLYLDMNGIIHPCFHPEEDDEENSPKTYDEVFNNIFEYIDRILNIVRPRKLLYMAIDGVAPRAKMNQQRTRRFRTAKDRKTLEEEEDRLRKQYEFEGKDDLPKLKSDVEDSNIITPGTEFMYELSKKLQTYIIEHIAKHPAWRSLRVILSDASSPGEGEHKIMSFIRLQRTCNGYNPNTSHVLYGLDADLIMLALATHEIHFSILRENVLAEASQTRKAKSDLNQGVEDAAQKMSNLDILALDQNRGVEVTSKKMSSLDIQEVKKSLKKKPYQFLHVWILREYLKLDLKIKEMPDKCVPDIERFIDDFIFICFFAGNDFLPHMPTLEIHEGAIDLLMHVYTEEFKNLGGYLVNVEKIDDRKGGYIKLKRVEKFILAVGTYEDRIFMKRSKIHESKLRRILSDSLAAEGHDQEDDLFPAMSDAYDQTGATTAVENMKVLKEQLKSYAREKSDIFKNGLVTDSVKFGSPGWRKRYYKSKFSAETEADMEKMRKIVVEKYTQGLCWVLLYYFSDVPSWTWFYPFHYGPFASDLKGLSSVKIAFSKGLPFKPFDQLMAVLPPTSAHALPAPYELLMTDEESSIHDFYPSDFETDTDGKRFLWQGVCKLPFIDEDRLLSATKKIEKELSAEEAKRNMVHLDKLFVHSSGNLASRIISSLNDAGLIEQSNTIKINLGLSGHDISGFVRPKMEPVKDPDVLCVYYELPSFSVHIPRVLAGSTFKETDVSEADIEERQLWHDSYGYHNNRNNRYHNPNVGSTGDPSVGFRNLSPNDVGAGSGWRGRGSGSSQDVTRTQNVINVGAGSGRRGRGSGSSQDATRTHDRKNRGWGGNNNPHGRGTLQGRASGYHTPPNHHTRTSGSSGQFWSSRSTESSSSSNRSFNAGSWRRLNQE